PGPVGIVEHQLDIGPLRYDLIEPALVEVVTEDAVVQIPGLGVGDALEVNAVQVLKGGQLVAVEAGGTGIVEVVPGPGPPVLELAARLPGRQGMVPGIVAIAPKAVEIHPFAVLGFNIAGKPVK